jgi:hypothetical protein
MIKMGLITLGILTLIAIIIGISIHFYLNSFKTKVNYGPAVVKIFPDGSRV